MRITKIFTGLAVSALMLVGLVGGVFAYSGQVAGQVVVSGPDFIIACGYDWTLQAHITESGTGDPIEGQPVHWEIIAQPAGASDTLTNADTVTNANGNTQTRITVTAGVYGLRTIQATADNVSTQFNVDCQANGLPPTSVLPGSEPLQASFNWMLLAAIGAVVAGFGIIGLRFVRR